MTDTPDLAELHALLVKAAGRPWKFPHRRFPDVVMTKLGCLWNPGTGRINNPDDADLIVAAVNALSWLLDQAARAERAEAEVERLRAVVDNDQRWECRGCGTESAFAAGPHDFHEDDCPHIDVRLKPINIGVVELRRLRAVEREARSVMDALAEYGPSIVPHLMDTDENAGERLRAALRPVSDAGGEG
jgi:hypothetical protein